MKRDNRGAPVMMVHRWNRPPLSCQPCRAKKRRCDRNQPCSNCSQRNINCEYVSFSQTDEAPGPTTLQQAPPTSLDPTPSLLTATTPSESALTSGDVLNRLRQLEAAVFKSPTQNLSAAYPLTAQLGHDGTVPNTPFGLHILSPSKDEPGADTAYIAHVTSQLPPLAQAQELFAQFAESMQPTVGVLHIPSTLSILTQTYHDLTQNAEPDLTHLLLLYTIFAGAAIHWTPQLLAKLNATQAEARAAFTAYTGLAMSILDNPHRPIAPSTVALAAMCTLAPVMTSAAMHNVKVYMLRMRCMMMARLMQIHRLDTAECIEERRVKGCDMVEVEVQRRVWWHMAASDWLSSFSGGPQEGSYIFQPKQMKVNYPANADDGSITPTQPPPSNPLTTPTSMTGFILRIDFAALCRDAADTLPSILLDPQEPDYDTVLALDVKFRAHMDALPVFFQLDAGSIAASRAVCAAQPDIAWQRTIIHFSLHSRLCRLHRPYHLSPDPAHAYSHAACIRAAQTVLELRRVMDDAGGQARFKPARSWVVMQHVFIAALILATDVSFSPGAEDAEGRRAKVMAAYASLERSREEASPMMEGIQKNMQTLMATLRGQGEKPDGLVAGGDAVRGSASEDEVSADNIMQDRGLMDAADGQEDLDQLWSEFLAVAPELDVPQWNSLLDDMDFNFQDMGSI